MAISNIIESPSTNIQCSTQPPMFKFSVILEQQILDDGFVQWPVSARVT